MLMNVDKGDFYRHSATSTSHVNVGSGEEISIRDLAQLIKSD